MSLGPFYVIFYNKKQWYLAEYSGDKRIEYNLTKSKVESSTRNPFADGGGYATSIEGAVKECHSRPWVARGIVDAPTEKELKTITLEAVKSKIALIKLGM